MRDDRSWRFLQAQILKTPLQLPQPAAHGPIRNAQHFANLDVCEAIEPAQDREVRDRERVLRAQTTHELAEDDAEVARGGRQVPAQRRHGLESYSSTDR